MATLHHQTEFWTHDLAPGQGVWISYGPSDMFKNGTVQVSATPATNVGGTTVHRVQTLSVPEVFITQVPFVSGDIVTTAAYAGFNVFNRGQHAVRNFALTLTVIRP
jgi:hypothetical protein